jgi:hypothetical protein
MGTVHCRVGSGLEQRRYALHSLALLAIVCMDITGDQGCTILTISIETSGKHNLPVPT